MLGDGRNIRRIRAVFLEPAQVGHRHPGGDQAKPAPVSGFASSSSRATMDWSVKLAADMRGLKRVLKWFHPVQHEEEPVLLDQ